MGNADSKQRIKDKTDDAMTSLKRQMSTNTGIGIKVSEPTSDPTFDELKAKLVVVPKNIDTFRKCYKRVHDGWAELKGANLAMAAAGKSFTDGTEWEEYHQKVEAWDIEPLDFKQVASPLNAYDKELAEYATMLKDCQKVVLKREKAQRELDFWRGQLEQLEASQREDDRNKLSVFRDEVDKARPAYVEANDEAIHAMQEVLAKGEELIKSAARALLQAQDSVGEGFPSALD